MRCLQFKQLIAVGLLQVCSAQTLLDEKVSIKDNIRYIVLSHHLPPLFAAAKDGILGSLSFKKRSRILLSFNISAIATLDVDLQRIISYYRNFYYFLLKENNFSNGLKF